MVIDHKLHVIVVSGCVLKYSFKTLKQNMQKCSMDLSRNQTQNLLTMRRLRQTLCSALVFYLMNSVASLYYYLQSNRILNICFSTPPVERSATTLMTVRTTSGPFCLKRIKVIQNLNLVLVFNIFGQKPCNCMYRCDCDPFM